MTKVFLLGLLLVVSSIQAPTPLVQLKQALVECERGAGDPAILACTTAIESNLLEGHDLAVAFFNRAVVYDKQRQFAHAISDYDQVLRLEPKSLFALLNRGMLLQQEHQSRKAISDLELAIALAPRMSAPFVFLGFSYDDLGEHGRALQELDKGVQLSPNDPRALAARGLSHVRFGEYGLAIRDLDKAIKLQPTYAIAIAERGVALRHSGRIAEAIRAFNQAVRMEPKNATILGARCWNGAVLKREMNLALRDCNKALRIRPDSAEAHGDRAFVYFQFGQYRKAIADYDSALKLDSDHASSLFGRGVAKRRVGDRAGGSKDIAAALAIDPKVQRDYASDGVTP